MNLRNIKRQFKEIVTNIISCGIMSNNDNSKEPIIHIRFNLKIWNNENLINFKDFILNEFRIKGLDNITNINNIVEKQYISYDNDNNIEKNQNILF